MGELSIEDALYNSLLYTPSNGEAPKTRSKGTVMFYTKYVYATDGYAVLRTEIQEPPHLGLATGDSVRKHLKDGSNLEFLDVSRFVDTYAYFDSMITEFESHLQDIEIGYYTDNPDFLISPARLARLSRLRPTGDYPLDALFVRDGLVFKYGPSTVGLIGLLDRKALYATDLPRECFW